MAEVSVSTQEHAGSVASLEHSEGAHGAKDQGFFAPDVSMVILTWFTFFALLAILYKMAWKPILTALEQREETLRKSLDEADRLKAELEAIEKTRQKAIEEAEVKAKAIVDESRKAAVEAAHQIQQKAKAESQIMLENVQREIKNETERARAQLKQEAIDVAIKLAGKLLEENLDDKKNRELINQALKES